MSSMSMPPRRDVGGDEHRQRTVGELVEHPLADRLREIAVDRLGGDAQVGERMGDAVTRPLRLTEHEDLGDRLADRPDNTILVHVVDGEEEVVHRADGVRRQVDRHLHRVGEVAADDVTDIAVERRREQHRLGAACAVPQNPLDLGREAVVGHPVGLVENDDVDVGHRDVTGLEQIDEAQRRGHDDVDAVAQRVDLLRAARPAVDGEDPLAAVVGDRFEHLGHLHGQLPGRYENEPEGAAGSRPFDDSRQHRHAERQRLARAGSGAAAHVVAGEGDGDRRALDLEWLGEASSGEAGVDAFGDTELGESGRHLDGG